MRFRRNKDGKLVRRSIKPPRQRGYAIGMDVVIEFGLTKCKFLTPYPKELDRALSAPYPGYVFTPQYKAGNWDGYHHFITRAGYFPTGLLPVVYHILKTGKNPLVPEEKKKHEVLTQLPGNVGIKIPDKCMEFFYPGTAQFYVNEHDILEDLNEENGTFIYPLVLLKYWKKVEDSNVFARSVLDFAKSLRNKDLGDT